MSRSHGISDVFQRAKTQENLVFSDKRPGCAKVQFLTSCFQDQFVSLTCNVDDLYYSIIQITAYSSFFLQGLQTCLVVLLSRYANCL